MKKILYTLPLLVIFFSCNQKRQSAFTGEVERTAPSVGTIPDESIYNLTDTFVTQDNQSVRLKDFAGKPAVVCMIFTHCTYACPRLTADVRNIEEKLGRKAGDVNFILISFDSKRDTPEQLKKFKRDMKLDDHFTLLHGSEETIRTFSVLMNVQFQQNADGDFSHSNIISLLDREGRLVYQKEGINVGQQETIDKLTGIINGPE